MVFLFLIFGDFVLFIFTWRPSNLKKHVLWLWNSRLDKILFPIFLALDWWDTDPRVCSFIVWLLISTCILENFIVLHLLFSQINRYLQGRVIERGETAEKGLPSTVTSGTELVLSRTQKLPALVPLGAEAQGPEPSSATHPGLMQGTGAEVEHPEHESLPIWDFSAASKQLLCYTTVLAPILQLSCGEVFCFYHHHMKHMIILSISS